MVLRQGKDWEIKGRKGRDVGAGMPNTCVTASDHAVYNLYAVSNHSGTTMGGHYTAYCRSPVTGEWHTFNDSR